MPSRRGDNELLRYEEVATLSDGRLMLTASPCPQTLPDFHRDTVQGRDGSVMRIASYRRLAKLERRLLPPPVIGWREGIDLQPTEGELATVAARGGLCISAQYVDPQPRDDD